MSLPIQHDLALNRERAAAMYPKAPEDFRNIWLAGNVAPWIREIIEGLCDDDVTRLAYALREMFVQRPSMVMDVWEAAYQSERGA